MSDLVIKEEATGQQIAGEIALIFDGEIHPDVRQYLSTPLIYGRLANTNENYVRLIYSDINVRHATNGLLEDARKDSVVLQLTGNQMLTMKGNTEYIIYIPGDFARVSEGIYTRPGYYRFFLKKDPNPDNIAQDLRYSNSLYYYTHPSATPSSFNPITGGSIVDASNFIKVPPNGILKLSFNQIVSINNDNGGGTIRLYYSGAGTKEDRLYRTIDLTSCSMAFACENVQVAGRAVRIFFNEPANNLPGSTSLILEIDEGTFKNNEDVRSPLRELVNNAYPFVFTTSDEGDMRPPAPSSIQVGNEPAILTSSISTVGTNMPSSVSTTNVNVTLRFDEPVEPGQFNVRVKPCALAASCTSVPTILSFSAVNYTEANRVLSFTLATLPTLPNPYDHAYTLTFPSGAFEDLAGNATNTDYSAEFTTLLPPPEVPLEDRKVVLEFGNDGRTELVPDPVDHTKLLNQDASTKSKKYPFDSSDRRLYSFYIK